MNLYEISNLENQIEQLAAANDGELSEEMLKALVEAETQSLVQIENLCKYIRKLELGIDMCKTEEERIKKMRDKADKRIDGIKKYLTPYVAKHGKIESGTFTLSTRESESVNILDENKIALKYFTIIPESKKPDKKLIKKALKEGAKIPGAELQKNDNLVIK